MDVLHVEGHGFVICDFNVTERKRLYGESGAFEVIAAYAGGDAFFLLERGIFNVFGDDNGVEHGA